MNHSMTAEEIIEKRKTEANPNSRETDNNDVMYNRPIRLTQCCTQFKSLCVEFA